MRQYSMGVGGLGAPLNYGPANYQYNSPFNNNYNMPPPFPGSRYGNQPPLKKRRVLGKRGYNDLDYDDEDDQSSGSDSQIPDSLFSEVTLGIIDLQYELLKSGKIKKNEQFFIQDKKESLYSAVFTSLNRLKITQVDRGGKVYYLAKEEAQASSHFTFKSEVAIYNAVDRKVCQTCFERAGQSFGNISISYLCQNCQEEAPNSFVLKQSGKSFLVVSDNPEELVSIEIKKENVTKKVLQFSLLDNLISSGNETPKLSVVTNELERSFVEFCFDSSKLPGNQRVIKVEKVSNRSVQLRFMNELKIVQQKNKTKPLHHLIRVLFHGTSLTPPDQIALSENGLNINYSNPGHYGNGIYFADNAAYSQTYAHIGQNGAGLAQLLLCFVIVGDTCVSNPQQFKEPPKRPDGRSYDSVNGAGGSHFIIYDNNKQFPCYIVSYQ